jgi:hypothetical protein
MRLWRNTGIASLAPGQSYVFPVGTLGYEWDSDADNGFRPAGLFHLSTATVTVAGPYLIDYGNAYGNGTATHHATLYRAQSGALVFGAGTVQWSWGLDSHHDNGSAAPDLNLQQATVNLLADMGVQPDTLQPGLVPATQSTDTVAPRSTITAPLGGSTLGVGTPVTITGTATDAGGGVVAGVEVSVDAGATWHPADGRSAWSYAWMPAAVGSYTIRSRAVDDSGNLERPGAGATVSVVRGTSGCPSCPTVWSSSASPPVPANTNDSTR